MPVHAARSSIVMWQSVILATACWLPLTTSFGASCPRSCVCSMTPLGNVVNCSSGSEIPSDLPPDTQALYMQQCKMPLFDWAHTPVMTNLRTMVLNECHIEDIVARHVKLDSLAPNVEILDVSHNSLSNLAFDSLWTSLRELTMRHNKICDIKDIVITNFPNLKELILSDNLVTVVSESSFATAGSAVELHLRRLVLNSNQIQHITADAFSLLTELRSLELADNQLVHVDGSWFKALHRLQQLVLRGNSLTHVRDDSFSLLDSLNDLDVSNTSLVAIPRGLPPTLELLDLSTNAIRAASETLDSGLSAVAVLHLADNPLHCDCLLRWLKVAYDRGSGLAVAAASLVPTCASPPSLAGDSWDVLDASMFSCEVTRSPDTSEKELIVRTGRVTDTTIDVVWRATGYAAILVQHYVFGMRDLTHKHVRVAPDQRQLTLCRLRPATNYVVCLVPSDDSGAAPVDGFIEPLTLQHCAEVRTAAAAAAAIGGVGFSNLAGWYLCAMLVTVAFVLITIGAVALLCGLFKAREAGDDTTSHTTSARLLYKPHQE